MKYQIERFTLCTIEGVATSAEGEFNIRPKTLQVLEYLIEHRNRIVTKREILEFIWADVVVQDQVLFQSVKELRDVFSGLTVIKTFPRKGYQWVARVEPISAIGVNRPLAAVNSVARSRYWVIAAIGLTVILSLNFAWYSNVTDISERPLNIAVLPVVDDMTDRDHQWVQLQGMDILINQLQQMTSLQVLSTDDVLFGLERSHSYAEPTAKELVYRVRQATGADVIVQTYLRGYPQDYQLHYSLISPHNVERGVEFADTIPALMSNLSNEIAKRFGSGMTEIRTYQSDFSNEAFASGVEHYMSEEFATAEPFLRAAVSANPELLAARRFLAGTLAHTGKLEQAIGYLEDNIERAKAMGNRREEVRGILMIGNWLANNDQAIKADGYLSRARTLAEDYDDQLFIAYAYEELGKIRRRSGDFSEAESLLKTALGYQRNFHCPYGQTTVLVELGSNAFAQGRRDEAERYLNQALKIADDNGVVVNRFWTLLALAEMHSANGDSVLSQKLALKAKVLAGEVHDDYLVNKANHWLAAVTAR